MAHRPKTHWIFDGGGFKGIFQAGAASVIWEGFPPQSIDAISVGALNAAKLLESGWQELKRFWLEEIEPFGPRKIIRKIQGAVRFIYNSDKNSFFDGDLLWKLVDDNIDMKKVADSPVTLNVGVTNETQSNRLDFFSKADFSPETHNDFKKIICASASLMGSFPPVLVGENWYSDALSFDLERALKTDCEIIFIFYNNHIWLSPPVPPQDLNCHKRLRRGINVSWSRSLINEIEKTLMRHRDLILWPHADLPEPILTMSNRWRRRKNASRKLVLVGPSQLIPSLSILDFKKGDLARSYELAQKLAEKVVRTLR